MKDGDEVRKQDDSEGTWGRCDRTRGDRQQQEQQLEAQKEQRATKGCGNTKDSSSYCSHVLPTCAAL